jgi:hypothetical protein
MAEPTTTSATGAVALASVLMLLLGPDIGSKLAPLLAEGLLIFAGAGWGAMHSMSKAHTATTSAAVWYLLKWTGTAFMLTGLACVLIEQVFSIPATRWPGAVAFAITFFADKWPLWAAAVLRRKAGLPADRESVL